MSSERGSGDLQGWMLAAMGCALQPRSAVYVSTPITTGPRFVAWRRGPGAGLSVDDGEYRRGRHEAVIEPNRADVAPLVTSLRARLDDPVIDPTALEDVPGWEQFDYHWFWTEVIHRYAHTALFADGWEYSSGCVLELAAAVSAGIAVRQSDLSPLSLADAVGQVERAIADVGRDDVLPQEPLQTALATLHQQAADSHEGAASRTVSP